MFFLVHEIKHFYLDKKRFLKFIFAMGTEPRAVSKNLFSGRVLDAINHVPTYPQILSSSYPQFLTKKPSPNNASLFRIASSNLLSVSR